MATRLPQLSLQPPPPPSPPPQQIIISPPRPCINGVDSCSPLCPNLCAPPLSNTYTRYPDDPSSTPSGSSSSLSPLLIALISILAAAFLLVSYYALSTSSFFRRNRGASSSDPTVQALQSQSQTLDPNTGLDESFINRIALLKYRKNDGLVVSTDCSVCLGEFKEDESLRLLPECTHAFHVECIDKWLESHSNCPICRASVVSVPQPVQAHVTPRVQPRESENHGSGDNNINSDSTGSNVRNGGGNHGISNSNPPLIREERRSGGLVVIVDPGPVGRVQEIIEVGDDSTRPVSRHPTLIGRENKPLKSSLMR
ncbi:E3 ubiquitin-protein ligase [Carex littledalei]|uniref:RING-type E3 ubiquitin transferase n=1 Tax=Carex littledalei TaxID=544730 RepID=A0A833QS01_9POAL|nr:E3 ubiquitin-protein ligase [Carex littledalei]